MIPTNSFIIKYFNSACNNPGLVPSLGIGGTAGICFCKAFELDQALSTQLLHIGAEERGFGQRKTINYFQNT